MRSLDEQRGFRCGRRDPGDIGGNVDWSNLLTAVEALPAGPATAAYPAATGIKGLEAS